jgi:hypothetical protein
MVKWAKYADGADFEDVFGPMAPRESPWRATSHARTAGYASQRTCESSRSVAVA